MQCEHRPRRRTRPMGDRFWEKVDASGDCWEWVASTFIKTGYGWFGVDGHGVGAHRVAWEMLVGPIPEGLHIDHLCRNRRCVNPDHLEPVTATENIRRGCAAAIQGRRTHCPHGHEYTPENTHHMRLRRGRQCRACHRIQEGARQRRLREVA